MEAFGRILDVLDELRVKCPWDRAQTTESLRPQTIEETYELSDAILKKDEANISKELGDVLLHVLFYAKIGEENGTYDIVDVINHLCDKLIYRHPHVFSSVQVADAAEVVKNWEQLKLKEKDGNKRVLSGVPETLPPLLKAYRMQDKARGVGFDWEDRTQVWDKVGEELGEFRDELQAMETASSEDDRKAAYERAETELGDYLFGARRLSFRHSECGTALRAESGYGAGAYLRQVPQAFHLPRGAYYQAGPESQGYDSRRDG